MEERTQRLIAECKRQEESCLYASTALFEWLKALRRQKTAFVVVPIVLGAIATWPILAGETFGWLTATCTLLASLAPAVYKALDYDVSVELVAEHAQQYKALQDRFRIAGNVTALGEFEAFRQEADALMERLDAARAASLTAPEKHFLAARRKIEAGHYSFAVDASGSKDSG